MIIFTRQELVYLKNVVDEMLESVPKRRILGKVHLLLDKDAQAFEMVAIKQPELLEEGTVEEE